MQHRRTGSQAMLEQAERAGLFLVPLDEVRGWRRCHRLFVDLLHTRLQAEQPRRMQELHRAAAWSDEHSLADDAVRHALAPGDTLWAARLTERYFDTFYYSRSEGATLKRWLSMLPAELVHARPRLLVVRLLWQRAAATWKRSRACSMRPNGHRQMLSANRLSRRLARQRACW